MMRLRRVLASTDCVIRTEPEGYRLEVRPELLDLHTFEVLVAQGTRKADEGQLLNASGLLAEALAMWRAVPPSSNVSSYEMQRDEGRRLEERYLHVVELRIELELQLDRHADLCAELLGLTASIADWVSPPQRLLTRWAGGCPPSAVCGLLKL